MSKEAMKLALEALKTAEDFDIDADDGYYLKAINALEEALAKQEPDYKALWQQMCERCDELDAKLAKQDHDSYDEVFIAYGLPKQEQGEPVGQVSNYDTKTGFLYKDLEHGTLLYTTPYVATQRQQRKPLMLEKFREMEALLDDNPHQHKKIFTDDELKIIMETTMPVIDWKARYGVELNNGERNKWMLEWFIAFARAIEAAHGIKGEA